MDTFSALQIGLFSSVLGVLVFGIIVGLKSCSENKRMRKYVEETEENKD